jgi:hypothetical protein
MGACNRPASWCVVGCVVLVLWARPAKSAADVSSSLLVRRFISSCALPAVIDSNPPLAVLAKSQLDPSSNLSIPSSCARHSHIASKSGPVASSTSASAIPGSCRR